MPTLYCATRCGWGVAGSCVEAVCGSRVWHKPKATPGLTPTAAQTPTTSPACQHPHPHTCKQHRLHTIQ